MSHVFAARLVALLFGLSLGLAACASAVAAGGDVARSGSVTDADLALVGVNIVRLEGEGAILEGQTILISDGRITAIGPAEALTPPDHARRIEVAGLFVLPGLADMHAHLEYIEDPIMLEVYLAYGVTSLRSMDGRPFIVDWRRQVENGTIAGPRIITAGPILDGDPPIRHDNTPVGSPQAGREAVRAQAAAGYDFIKLYDNVGLETFDAVLDEARTVGLPVGGHVPRALPLQTAIERFISIEHLVTFGDAVALDPDARWNWSHLFMSQPTSEARMAQLAERLAAHEVFVVPTLIERERAVLTEARLAEILASDIAHTFPEWGLKVWEAQVRRFVSRIDDEEWATLERGRQSRFALLRAFDRAGVNLAIGTDTPNAFVFPGVSVHDEIRLFVEAGLYPARALRAATSDAARLVRQDSQWGRIAAGLEADLVLLKANPLDSLDALDGIQAVIVDGRVLEERELARMRSAIRSVPPPADQ